MVDAKTKRKFLKRTRVESVNEKMLFVGSSFNLYGRQLTVVDFANEHTRKALGKTLEKSCVVLLDPSEATTVFTRVAESELQVAAAVMVSGPSGAALIPSSDHVAASTAAAATKTKTAIVFEVVGGDALRRCAVFARDLPAYAATDADKAAIMIESTFGASRGTMPNTATYNDTALCVIKSSALVAGQAGAILAELRREGFVLTALQTFVLEQQNAEEFLEIYKGVLPTSDYKALVTEFVSGPVLALEVRWPEGATQQVLRRFVGPADVEVAQALYPLSLRAKYGIDKTKNAVHCTDLPEDAQLELEYFFTILGGV